MSEKRRQRSRGCAALVIGAGAIKRKYARGRHAETSGGLDLSCDPLQAVGAARLDRG